MNIRNSRRGAVLLGIVVVIGVMGGVPGAPRAAAQAPAAATGKRTVLQPDQPADNLKRKGLGTLLKGEIVLKEAATTPVTFKLGDELEFELVITVDESPEARSLRAAYRYMNPTDQLRAYAYYLALFDNSGQMIFCSADHYHANPGVNVKLGLPAARLIGGGTLPLPRANIDRVSYQLRYYESDEKFFPPDSDLSKMELPIKGNLHDAPLVVKFGKENAVSVRLGKLVDFEARLFVLGSKTTTNFSANPYHRNPGKQAVRYTYRLALFGDSDQLIACGEMALTLEPARRGNGSLSFYMPEAALRSVAKYDLQYSEKIEQAK